MSRLKKWRIAQNREKVFWREYKVVTMEGLDIHAKYYKVAIDLMSGIEECQDNDIILDVGCGPGDMLNLVHAEFKIGLDPLFPYFKKQGFAQRTFEGILAVGENLPFRSNTFGKVFCYNVLDHTADPKRVYLEIRRVMKDTGYLLLALDVRSPMLVLIRMIAQLGIKKDPLHPHSFLIGNVVRLLSKLGFSIVSIRKLFSLKPAYSIVHWIDSLGIKCRRDFVCIIAKKM